MSPSRLRTLIGSLRENKSNANSVIALPLSVIVTKLNNQSDKLEVLGKKKQEDFFDFRKQ